jgi:hypothetical protein
MNVALRSVVAALAVTTAPALSPPALGHQKVS